MRLAMGQSIWKSEKTPLPLPHQDQSCHHHAGWRLANNENWQHYRPANPLAWQCHLQERVYRHLRAPYRPCHQDKQYLQCEDRQAPQQLGLHLDEFCAVYCLLPFNCLPPLIVGEPCWIRPEFNAPIVINPRHRTAR